MQASILRFVATSIGKPDIVVTDFGGATGELGEDFLQAFPEARYVVVENQILVEMMQGRQTRVEFATELPSVCDVFFSAGTIQYLADPMGPLRKGFGTAKHAVVLTRNCFANVERFGLQHSMLFENGGGPVPPGWENRKIAFPHRTIVEKHIAGIAQSTGFACLGRVDEQDGAILPESYGRQLIYWKRGS